MTERKGVDAAFLKKGFFRTFSPKSESCAIFENHRENYKQRFGCVSTSCFLEYNHVCNGDVPNV